MAMDDLMGSCDTIQLDGTHLRYSVWYNNPFIFPQMIAAFFSEKLASAWIISMRNAPTGTYVIKDNMTKKDVGIIPVPGID